MEAMDMRKNRDMRQLGLGKVSLLTFLLFTFYFLLAPAAQAQEEIPKNAAAPPIKALMKEEKEKLEAEKDVKRRLTLALGLMETRLKNAETLHAEENFADMFTEMGFFHALMDNTLNFLERNNYGTSKILNQYKRFEMSLRGFIGRLEVIRRELAPRYEYYVRSLVKAVRDARTRAVEPLYDDTVVPNKS